MFRILHVVAAVTLASGWAPACQAGTFVGESGVDSMAAGVLSGSSSAQQPDARGTQNRSLTARHTSDASALVFGPQSGGYFSEAYGTAPHATYAMVVSTAAADEASGFAAPLARQHVELAASGDTFVLTALSSKLASTPEPASLALLGTGALSAVAMLRRRVH